MRRLHRDDGFSLVELMVVLLLSGIVLGVAANALVQSQRTVSGTFQRQADLGEARNAVDAASADLRTMTPLGGTYLLTATAREVSFFARRDVPIGRGPVRITLRVESNGDLVRYSTAAPVPSPSPTSAVVPSPSAYATALGPPRILASGIPAGATVFRYYSSYTLVPSGPSPQVTASAAELPMAAPSGTGQPGVPAANQSLIRFVDVRLDVEQGGARNVGVTTVRQVVRLPNLVSP